MQKKKKEKKIGKQYWNVSSKSNSPNVPPGSHVTSGKLPSFLSFNILTHLSKIYSKFFLVWIKYIIFQVWGWTKEDKD